MLLGNPDEYHATLIRLFSVDFDRAWQEVATAFYSIPTFRLHIGTLTLALSPPAELFLISANVSTKGPHC